MEPGRIALRALFAYIYLFVMLRIGGKRTIRQGTAFDFVVALIVGDMIDDALWAEVPIAQFIVGTGTLLFLQVLTSAICRVSPRFTSIVEGVPARILHDGMPDRDGLRNERMNENELEEALRLRGIEREKWSEVENAWIEIDGSPAVLRKPEAKTVQKKDLENLRRIMK